MPCWSCLYPKAGLCLPRLQPWSSKYPPPPIIPQLLALFNKHLSLKNISCAWTSVYVCEACAKFRTTSGILWNLVYMFLKYICYKTFKGFSLYKTLPKTPLTAFSCAGPREFSKQSSVLLPFSQILPWCVQSFNLITNLPGWSILLRRYLWELGFGHIMTDMLGWRVNGDKWEIKRFVLEILDGGGLVAEN